MSSLQITLDSSALRALAQLGGDVQTAADQGVEAAAQAVLLLKQAKTERTYDTDIPESASGRPLWERTGELRDGQAVQVLGEAAREVGPTNGAALYEPELSELHTGADGINRSNPAATDTYAEAGAPAQDAFNAEVQKAIDHASS